MSVNGIINALQNLPRRAGHETVLQDAIADAFTRAGLDFDREVVLGRTSRIDFLVGDIGIEVKVAGSRADVIRQLHRYSQEERIAVLVLATTCMRHARMPESLSDKPVRVVHLFGGSL